MHWRQLLNAKLATGRQTKNSFLVSVQWEGEELLTTKKEKQFHGMGIGIVKRLAEKYGGTLMLEEKGSNFITTLIISACKK